MEEGRRSEEREGGGRKNGNEGGEQIKRRAL